MLPEGTTTELIVKLDPSLYRKHLWHNQKGKQMLYVQLKKCFWKLLSNTLHEWGFTISDYDQCVTNKIINGNQCMIIWHVDDLKMSQV